jgi:hypothetical protein
MFEFTKPSCPFFEGTQTALSISLDFPAIEMGRTTAKVSLSFLSLFYPRSIPTDALTKRKKRGEAKCLGHFP